VPARKIDFYLNSSGRLRALTEQARRLAELQQVFLKVAPQSLTQASCVKLLRAQTLVLLAGNAAVAAKLKQLVPRLLTAYGKQAFEITSIHVEVQVDDGSQQPPTSRRTRRLSTESIKDLEALADGMEDSPLKRALAAFAANQRTKITPH
jgi:hypothetical protein